jgi:molybdopterin synthase catalytic subunit
MRLKRSGSITRRRIDPGAVLAQVADPGAGGAVLFIGTVRNSNEGRRVTALEYEVYRTMAEERMEAIARELRRRWTLKKVRMVHREGRLEVGDVSVAVAVSAEHRAEAFEACRYAIDAIKTSLPLWKKEYGKGKTSWVEGVPLDR